MLGMSQTHYKQEKRLRNRSSLFKPGPFCFGDPAETPQLNWKMDRKFCLKCGVVHTWLIEKIEIDDPVVDYNKYDHAEVMEFIRMGII